MKPKSSVRACSRQEWDQFYVKEIPEGGLPEYTETFPEVENPKTLEEFAREQGWSLDNIPDLESAAPCERARQSGKSKLTELQMRYDFIQSLPENERLKAAYALGLADAGTTNTGDEAMTVEMKEGDVLFHRVTNGWVVKRFTDGLDNFMVEVVYEDSDAEHAASESLGDALWEAFDDYYQSKYTGGLVVKWEPKGREVSDASDL